MFYRENGQFKTSYAADQAIFPVRQDRIAIAAILIIGFIGVPLAEYTRNAQRNGSALLPNDFREAHRGGDFFLTLEIAAKLNLAVLPALQAQVRDRLPTSLREDNAADWQQWPMRIKPTFDP